MRRAVPLLRFDHVEKAIADSKQLLELPTNWDDEGAKRISAKTWNAAVRVLRKASRVAYQRFEFMLPSPRIGPCHDGSLDIYWRTESFTLLINIAAKGSHVSDFYAEKGGVEVKGPLHSDNPDFAFLYWLVQ
jgi:hypothetical protein